MDGFHFLLRRSWQYDRDVNHNGRTNTYIFIFDGVKFILLPSRQVLEKSKIAGEATALLSLARVNEDLQESEIRYRLLEKGVVHGNMKHLIPFTGDSSDDDAMSNSRPNFLSPRGNDVDQAALAFMEEYDRRGMRT